jgi:cyclopropane-fatty-acyl-phospholipid synthase
MRGLLDRILKRFMVLGRLTVRWPDGSVTTYAGNPGPEAVIEIRDAATVRRLALNPALTVGEAYMDGGLVPVDCQIYDVLDTLMSNMSAEASGQTVLRLREMLGMVTRRIAQFNPAGRA